MQRLPPSPILNLAACLQVPTYLRPEKKALKGKCQLLVWTGGVEAHLSQVLAEEEVGGLPIVWLVGFELGSGQVGFGYTLVYRIP